MDQGLGERLFSFAIDTLKILGTFFQIPEAKIIRYQLAKSSTSSGANYEEAQAESSRADFANKIKISLKRDERI
jgi:four helix bundle protein